MAIAVTQAIRMEEVAARLPDGVVSIFFFAPLIMKSYAEYSQETQTSIAQPDVNPPLEAAVPLRLLLHPRNPLRPRSPKQADRQCQGTHSHPTKRDACGW